MRDALGLVLRALGEAEQPRASFAALERAAQWTLGHRLFTIMRHDPAAGVNRRVWSSDPLAYPPGGAKPIRETEWTRHLLREGRPFIGRDAAAIRATFPDAELILSLGCESVLNLPVRWQGGVIGTLNLLDRAGAYAPHHARQGRILAALAIPALLSA
ncbi:MAG: GAF domain-containing protein [Roseococcus sp.]|nr:GAF domain-containing protein [Roseococcus sp.]